MPISDRVVYTYVCDRCGFTVDDTPPGDSSRIGVARLNVNGFETRDRENTWLCDKCTLLLHKFLAMESEEPDRTEEMRAEGVRKEAARQAMFMLKERISVHTAASLWLQIVHGIRSTDNSILWHEAITEAASV
jgi:hypothetical protein